MLPVVAGAAATKRADPDLCGDAGRWSRRRCRRCSAWRRSAYGVVAAALGARVRLARLAASSACRRATARCAPARRLFAFSMLYLFLLFAVLLVERRRRRAGGMSESVMTDARRRRPPHAEQQLRRRRARSIAIAVALAVLVALFYVVTIVKLGGNVAGPAALMSRPARRSRAREPRPHRRASASVFVAGMVGMSFAAVPLYRIFCQVTGYGGTTQRPTRAPAADARPRSSPSASTPTSATASAGASARSSAR